MNPQVAIIIGSKSDKDKMVKAADILDELEILFSFNIYSAHRTPGELKELIKKINDEDACKVIIAGAAMSAALAGSIASMTTKPVIGVPLSGDNMNSLTALLSTVQMPPGIPVLTVGIDSAKNAALAAASIIALTNESLKNKLLKYREDQKKSVLESNRTCSLDEHKYYCL